MTTYLIPISAANPHSSSHGHASTRQPVVSSRSSTTQRVDGHARAVFSSIPIFLVSGPINRSKKNPFIQLEPRPATRPAVQKIQEHDDADCVECLELNCIGPCLDPLLDAVESIMPSVPEVLQPLLSVQPQPTPTKPKAISKPKAITELPAIDGLPPQVYERLFACIDKEQLYPLSLTNRFFRANPQLGELFKREKSFVLAEYTRKLFGVETRETASRKEWNHFQRKVIQSAARNGHLNLLHYYQVTLRYPLNKLVDRTYWSIDRYAAKGGHLEVLKWLHGQGFTLNDRLLEAASRRGHLHILTWLVSIGNKFKDEKPYVWHNSCFREAAEGGHMETLNWLEKQGCPLFPNPELTKLRRFFFPSVFSSSEDDTTCRVAKNGHLDALKWLMQRNFPFHSETMKYAAEGGHLATLQWLNIHRVALKLDPLNEKIMQAAAGGGHLPVIQWLRNKNCPWDGYATAFAARDCHLEVLAWLLDNGCPWSPSLWRCYRIPEEGKHLPVLEWLRKRGLIPPALPLVQRRLESLADKMQSYALGMEMRYLWHYEFIGNQPYWTKRF